MNNIKITLFQKNINTPISKEQKIKLIAQKSDFLVFPSFFFLNENSKIEQIISDEKKYTDSMLEISEYYKGVIIGGSFLRKVDGKVFESSPLIQDISLIDWYDSHSPQKEYNTKITSGNGDCIYILGKIRFGICMGKESADEKKLEFFKKEKIEVVFNPSLNVSGNDLDYENELLEYAKLSAKYNLNIFKINSIGKFFNSQNLIGRSFHSASSGIKWKVANSEKDLEIIKTVNVNLFESLLSFKS